MKLPTLEEIEQEELRLLEINNPYGLLNGRERALATVMATASKNVLDNIILLEFGAAHYLAAGNPFSEVYDPSISCFFGYYGNKIRTEYYAFDPKYSDEKLNKDLMSTYGKGDFIESLRRGVQAINLRTYQQAVAKHEQILKSGKTPVIFSNHVLNDPQINLDYPFWSLEGLHIHRAGFQELFKCMYRQIDFNENPQKCLDSFKTRFSLEEKVYAFLSEDMINIFWKK